MPSTHPSVASAAGYGGWPEGSLAAAPRARIEGIGFGILDEGWSPRCAASHGRQRQWLTAELGQILVVGN